MAGGKGKINEHPKAGTNNFKHRKGDINRSGANRKYSTSFFLQNFKDVEGLTKAKYYEALAKLLELSEAELIEVRDNPDAPAWIKLTIKDLLNEKTRAKIMTEVLDRLYGKAKEEYVIKGEMEVNTNIVAPIQVVIDGIPK